MSQENVDVVLASIEAFNAGDMDAQMATYLPTAVAVVHGSEETRLPDVDARMEGRVAIRQQLTEMRQAWAYRYSPSEVRAVSEDMVLCHGRIGGVGATTGIEALREASVLFRLRGGLIERVDFFDDPDAALEAAGVEE